MLGLAVIPAILLRVGVALFPDTPRWLVRNGDVWQSADRGDTWQPCTLTGEPPAQLLALAAAD